MFFDESLSLLYLYIPHNLTSMLHLQMLRSPTLRSAVSNNYLRNVLHFLGSNHNTVQQIPGFRRKTHFRKM